MQQTNRSFYKRVGLLVVVLLVCVGVYSARPKTFPVAQNTSAQFANAVILKDWMPDAAYNATLQRISYYLAIYNIAGTNITITDTPHYTDDGSLSFDFSTGLDSVLYGVAVQTTSYGGGISSSAVTINGKLVTYSAATSLYGAQYTNFDSLLNYGLTGQQVYEIQQALNRFAPNGAFDIATSTISQQFSGPATKTAFTVSINGKQYRLISTSSDINEVQLVLLNSKNKTVFDSGLINFSN